MFTMLIWAKYISIRKKNLKKKTKTKQNKAKHENNIGLFSQLEWTSDPHPQG